MDVKKISFVLPVLPLMLIMTLFALNYQFLMMENREEKIGAYFTKALYPSMSYQGEKTVLSLTIYNKNCTVDDEDYGSFFFLLYLDGDQWLNEYNDTDYKTWRCDKESSITRCYIVLSWETLKPVVHSISVELYWFDGKTPHLQDNISFSIPVAVYVGPTNLIILSYQITYLIAIGLIGFYMLLEQPIKILLKAHNSNVISSRQLSKKKLAAYQFKNSFFLFFYMLILISQYLINWLLNLFSIAELLRQSIYIIVQFFHFLLLILVIKKEKSNLMRYGYFWPKNMHKYILVSLMLALVYSFVVIFVPGIFEGYYIFPSPNFTLIILVVLQAIVVSLASGAIFYGYIQSKFRKIIGSSSAFVITSILFALYMLPGFPFGFLQALYGFLSLFILGLFIGFLRYRTRTMLCSTIFYFTFLILKFITPIKGIASEQIMLSSELTALGLSSILLLILVERRKPTVPFVNAIREYNI
jgi:membrane protease YdiL (CAAX protease family)